MDFPLDMWACIGAGVAALAGAYVQGCVGFGLGLVSVPVLVLINPMLVPGPLLLASIVLNVLITAADRQAVHLGEVKRAVIGAVPGTFAGAALLWALPATGVEIGIGVLVLLAVGLAMSGWHAPPTYRNVTIAGFLSGVMGTAATIGGPPMAIVYSREAAAKIRGTMAGFFIFVGLVAIGPLTYTGRLTADHWLVTLPLLPGLFVGFGLSRVTGRYIPQSAMRPLVLIIATVGAIVLIVKAAGFR